jgi:hypothetical protein
MRERFLLVEGEITQACGVRLRHTHSHSVTESAHYDVEAKVQK